LECRIDKDNAMTDEAVKSDDTNNANKEDGDPKIPTRIDDGIQAASNQTHPYPQHKPSKNYVKPALVWVWCHLKSATLWTTLATIVIAVATVFYVRYSGKQMRIINDQLIEMRNQTELNGQEAVALQQAVVRIQVSNFVLESPMSKLALPIDLRNEGIAVATKVGFHGALT